MIQAAIRAIALRSEFLDAFAGTDQAPLVGAVIELVLDILFDDARDAGLRWQLVRQEAVSTAIRVILEQLSRATLDDDTMAVIRAVLNDKIVALPAGKPIDWIAFASDIEKKLAA